MRRDRVGSRFLWILAVALLVACGGPASSTPSELVTPTMAALPPVTPSATTSAAPTPSPAAPSSEPGQAAATATLPARKITLDSPSSGALIRSPVQVTGSVSVSPFEATLVGRVYDAGGQLVGERPVMVDAEMGQPGQFQGEVAFQVDAGGPGRVEVAELSAKDGSVVVSATVDVMLEATPGAGTVDIPAAGAQVVLPMRVLAHVGKPGQQVNAVLRWQDGTELEQTFTTLSGADGQGLLIDSLNWPNEGPPPQPATQPATLELRDAAGDLLASQKITVLSLDDPETQAINLYFLLGETVQPVQRRIPMTAKIGTAALEELLWGPLPPNLAGFGTALPTPQEVLSFPGREPDWGPRVTLRGLTIVDGLATADFSKEMRAYGGGSLRVTLIREQVEQTLKQFPTVRQVAIAIEGETEGALQP